MKVIFNKPSRGYYGVALPGQEVEIADEVGKQLIGQGIARHAHPPAIEYETKVIVPSEAPEVSAREPFRELHHADEKPETVDSQGNKVLSTSNIFEPAGTPDTRRRGRRSGSDSE